MSENSSSLEDDQFGSQEGLLTAVQPPAATHSHPNPQQRRTNPQSKKPLQSNPREPLLANPMSSSTSSASAAGSRPMPPTSQGSRPPPAGARLLSPQEQEAAIERARQLQAEREQQQAEEERILDLKYGAESVLALIKPVSFCMLIVVATIRSVTYFSQNNTTFVYTPFESSTGSSGQKFGGALLNAVIIIAIVVAMTFVLLLLYKYRCYKAIHGWLILSSLLLLFFFSYQYIDQVLLAYNKSIDWITLAIVVWNFGCVGLAVIHWRGPLLLQQIYLVLISALMALVLIKNLPDWTTWVVLAAIAIYDLFAVLAPCGPLKALVETAQERDEPLFPALIYSSGMAWIVTMATGDTEDGDKDFQRTGFQNRSSTSVNSQAAGPGAAANTVSASARATTVTSTGGASGTGTSSTAAANVSASNVIAPRTYNVTTPHVRPLVVDPADPNALRGGGPVAVGSINAMRDATERGAGRPGGPQPPQSAPEGEEDVEPQSGVKLGLGDFIFYSVLVGKAATADQWTTITACYVGILIGLACTLLLLSIYQRALPALPISICFGLIFYFTTSESLDPMINLFNESEVFI